MLTVKAAAERAGVSVSLIYSLCAEGRLPHVRLGREGRRGTIRIRESDLSEFLEASVSQPASSVLDEALKFIR
jgi:excisionase family DNA binding protein